jgi:hypothetical protein
MSIIFMNNLIGTFAENKDTAREIRLTHIMPAMNEGREITLDFSDVTGATQSFIHALISDAIRQYGETALDLIEFRNCNAIVREVVITVTEYMQESRITPFEPE